MAVPVVVVVVVLLLGLLLAPLPAGIELGEAGELFQLPRGLSLQIW